MSAETSVIADSLAAGGFGPDTSIDEVAAKPDEAISVYARAAAIREELERKSKEVSRLMSQLEPDIIRYFTEKGQQRVTRLGRTVYLARELWPKILTGDPVDPSNEAAVEAAAKNGRMMLVDALAGDPQTAHLVSPSYNHQTLRSFLLNDCELGDDDLPVIPEHLKGKLGVSEVFKAKVVKSG